jgi:AcrR family transcriptional regulator
MFEVGEMSEIEVLPERIRMRKHDRRAAILAEAIGIIGDQGFRGFSINELARRCELTTAGLLHHFGSKEGLLIALLEERDRRNQDSIAGRLGMRRGEPLTREQVIKVLHAIVAQNASQPDLVRLYTTLRAEALGPDHPAQDYFRERERATIGLFAEIVAPHAVDAQATAMQLQATMYGLQVQWLGEDCGFDLVAAWDAASDKLLR